MDLKNTELGNLIHAMYAAIGGNEKELPGAVASGLSTCIIVTRKNHEGVEIASSRIGDPIPTIIACHQLIKKTLNDIGPIGAMLALKAIMDTDREEQEEPAGHESLGDLIGDLDNLLIQRPTEEQA